MSHSSLFLHCSSDSEGVSTLFSLTSTSQAHMVAHFLLHHTSPSLFRYNTHGMLCWLWGSYIPEAYFCSTQLTLQQTRVQFTSKCTTDSRFSFTQITDTSISSRIDSSQTDNRLFTTYSRPIQYAFFSLSILSLFLSRTFHNVAHNLYQSSEHAFEESDLDIPRSAERFRVYSYEMHLFTSATGEGSFITEI